MKIALLCWMLQILDTIRVDENMYIHNMNRRESTR